ncbi:MAG TPA: hypothetical protein VFV90_13685 [Usitatibacter sp.]|nr:hypothetical protein [Usitatibacter sp.]
MKHLAILAIVLVAALVGPAVPAGAQVKPDDAMRAALEESKASGKGLTFHIKGTTLGGAVTGVGSSYVTIRNQAGIGVIRIDSIDAVAGAITLK